MIALLWRTATLFLLVGFWFPAAAGPAFAQTDDELAASAKKLNAETKTLEDADAKLKALLKDKPATTKLLAAALKMQKGAKGDEKPFRYFSTLVLAKAAHSLREYDAADAFYKACSDIAIDDLQSSEHIIRAISGHMGYLMGRKKYDQLEELCERVLAINGDDTLQNYNLVVVFGQLLSAQARNGKLDAALEKADNAIKRFDGHFVFHRIKARLLADVEKYDDALKAYETMMDSIKDNERASKEDKAEMIREVKYAISGIHVSQNKIDEGTKILRELVKEEPDNATYKNDLGFVMCDNDKNLEESEKLIREAIELDLKAKAKLADEGKMPKEEAKKPNAAYIDSLGWVLYKNKKYEEALKHLLESAGSDDEESNHIEIWDHVGDCYLALGKKKEALETFQKALKMDDVTKKDAERRKKVTEKIKKLKADVK
jgi:tetratricopeptide (TPR) repeat protein